MIFPTIEKTGRKTYCIREQIIGIARVSGRDFDNVSCVEQSCSFCEWSCSVCEWSCSVVSVKRKGFLET